MDSHSVEKVQPYTDPILKHNQGEYIGFLKELQDRNMLRFQRAEGHPSMLGIFFVRKKSGKLRLIFDTRLLNQYFNDLPTQIFPQLMLLQDLKHARMQVSMLGLVIYQTLFTLFQFLMTLRGDLPCRQLRLESLA